MAANSKNFNRLTESYMPNAFVNMYEAGGPGDPPAIATYNPTLPSNYAADYAARLKEVQSNAIDPKTGAPFQGSGGQDSASTGTGGNYRPLTAQEKAAKIAELESYGVNDLRPDVLEQYLSLKNNKPYYVASARPDKFMYEPYDLRAYTPMTAQQLAAAYPAPVPPPPSIGYATDPYTGRITPGVPNTQNGETFQVNRQMSQYLESAYNTPEARAKREAIDQERSINTNLIKQLSEEQLKEMRESGLTPSQYAAEKGLKFPTFNQAGAYSFAAGGDLDNPESTFPTTAADTAYGDLPPEVVKYMNMPGANPDKILQWFNLGVTEPQTFNQARLLAEAVGYNPEQAKVVAAQWQMESSGGSRLSSPYNYFGIKSHNEGVRNKLIERGIGATAGADAETTEVKDGKKVSKNSSFMEFNNAIEGFAAHKAFLETNPRYAKALAAENAKDFAVGLEKAGYATAANYGLRLYQDYVAPKEKNPKSGDIRPKSFGETKSEKIKPFTLSELQPEVGPLPTMSPMRLEVEPQMDLNPTTAPGMYGSTSYQQKVEDTKAIPMSAKPMYFGSGKTMFEKGGTMNFKSAEAYKNWLGYVHATGVAESTPGNQNVSIRKEPHTVQHQYGGHMYAQGGFNNSGFKALPAEVQNKIMANSFAEGGNMGNQLTSFDGGFKHDDPNPQNVNSGVPQGIAPDGRPNVTEKGETKLDSANYIFSDNLKVTKEVAKEFNLPSKVVNKTYADASKKLNLDESRREGDTIENKYKEEMLSKLMQAQEVFKEAEMQKDFAAMAQKYPQQMAAMMQASQQAQAPGGQMSEIPPGELAAAGVNPAQEAPSPEAIPSSQLPMPMSYGGSMYMCGGKMYDFGGFVDDNSGAMSGAASGFLSGASTGAALGAATGPLAFIGAPLGAVIGGTVAATAGGIAGHKKDEAQRKAEEIAKQEQVAQNSQMNYMPGMPYTTPAASNTAGYPMMAANGGPLYHQYPQLTDQWKNNAGPMGQGLTHTQIYADGGHMYDGESETSGFMNSYVPQGIDYVPQSSDGNSLLKNPWARDNNMSLPYSKINYNFPKLDFSKTGKTAADDLGHYKVDPKLTSTAQDLSVTGSPWLALSQLAPVAYNTYQALSKAKTYKPSDFYTMQEAIRPDYTQAENEARYTYANLMNSIKAAGLSGGNYATNAQNAANLRNREMAQIAMAEENAFREDQAKVRGLNAAAETEGKKLAAQTNWAIQAAKQESGKEALKQFKDMQESDLANELATNYAIMGAPDITRFKKIGYTPYLEYLAGRNKRNNSQG